MRTHFVAGLACVLLALPACGDDGGTTAAATATTTGDATMSGTSTSGGTETGPTTGGAMCPEPGAEIPGSVMNEFGSACNEDADCKAILGDDGVCLKDILGIYGLPCGYCSKLCMLPDAMTKYVPDDAFCGGGAHCIGVDGYFEGCVIECTDDSQCPRDGYECRILPQIGAEGDPKFCLMTDDNTL